MIIKKVSITQKDAIELIDELSDILFRLTGSSGRASFHNSDMENERAVFAIAYEDEKAVGCGAIREVSDSIAEIKRVYARDKGHGIGSQILCFLEQQAKQLNYTALILETRKNNENAVQFYLHHGYYIIDNYGKYADRPEAVCFQKDL